MGEPPSEKKGGQMKERTSGDSGRVDSGPTVMRREAIVAEGDKTTDTRRRQEYESRSHKKRENNTLRIGRDALLN
jgi:hypothetical protein